MFGRHLELNLVKTKKSATTEESNPEILSIDYAKLAEEAAKTIVIGIVTVMAARFVFSTAEHLIVRNVQPRITVK